MRERQALTSKEAKSRQDERRPTHRDTAGSATKLSKLFYMLGDEREFNRNRNAERASKHKGAQPTSNKAIRY